MALNETLERLFPSLRTDAYKVTSPTTLMYNCVAWAAEITYNWWWPSNEVGCYWPPDAPFAETLDSFIAAFATLDYEACDEDSFESGYDRIAIYVNPLGSPTHVARQLSSGTWTSKIGELEDIEHTALSALEGTLYGSVAQIMKRARK